MALPPVSGIGAGISGVAGLGAAQPAAAGTGAVDFAAGLEKVAELQTNADALGVKVASGDAADVHEFMAAASKASLAMELTVAVRNRAVEAYQEVMRMQV